MSKRKLGAGHAEAMLRLGLKELRNAANPSRESVADTEIGLAGTATQGEIAEARGGPGRGPEQEASKKLSLEEMRKGSQKRGRGDDNGRDDERGKDRGGMDR